MSKGPYDVSIGVAQPHDGPRKSFDGCEEGERWAKAFPGGTSIVIRDGDKRVHRIFERTTGEGAWADGGIWGDGR